MNFLRKYSTLLLAKFISTDDVQWIVNDIGELGVKIGRRFFFIYKGYSLEYKNGHDNGQPMRWRPVYKREFGEVVHPINYASAHLTDSGSTYTHGEGWKEI